MQIGAACMTKSLSAILYFTWQSWQKLGYNLASVASFFYTELRHFWVTKKIATFSHDLTHNHLFPCTLIEPEAFFEFENLAETCIFIIVNQFFVYFYFVFILFLFVYLFSCLELRSIFCEWNGSSSGLFGSSNNQLAIRKIVPAYETDDYPN